MTLHVVQYSGGIGSWAATRRVIAAHGTDNLVLLVADTQIEDDDLWRFVADSTARFGVPPTIVTDGRTPFEVFRDRRFLVLSSLDNCRARDIPPRTRSPTRTDYTSLRSEASPGEPNQPDATGARSVVLRRRRWLG
jgi:hypothetical protein